VSRRAWVEQVMGLPVSIHLRGPDVRGPEAERAVAAAYAELARLDAVFSTYRPDSPISRRRRGDLAAGSGDPLVEEVERICAVAAERTGGAFTAWLPDADGVLRFDPTGLVKGWAVDRAARDLSGLPATAWSVNAGGDVLVGRHAYVPPEGADAAPWRIGVEDPRDRSRMVAVVPLTTGAVATSGTAARGAHLYDPANRQPVDRAGSMTVVADTLLWADVWATALFVGGERAREAFARNAPGAQMFAA
jgi:thiamine biosynthesis lipoprotein